MSINYREVSIIVDEVLVSVIVQYEIQDGEFHLLDTFTKDSDQRDLFDDETKKLLDLWIGDQLYFLHWRS